MTTVEQHRARMSDINRTRQAELDQAARRMHLSHATSVVRECKFVEDAGRTIDARELGYFHDELTKATYVLLRIDPTRDGFPMEKRYPGEAVTRWEDHPYPDGPDVRDEWIELSTPA